MSQDVISDCLNNIMNAKKAGKQEVSIKRHSKLLINILEIAKRHNYLDYSVDRNKMLKIKILNLMKCMTIKPRFNAKADEIEKYERRFMPARNMGVMIISTNKGLMTSHEAHSKKLGGSLIACFY